MPEIRRTTWWWKPLRAFSRQGFITHISEPNRSTACTTITKNITIVLLSAPSLPQIFTNPAHFPHARGMFCYTIVQSFLKDETFCPKHLDKRNSISSVSYADKTLPIQPLLITFWTGPTHRWCRVRPIECLLWDKHVTLGAPGVGINSPPPGLPCCPEVVGEKISPGGLSERIQ